MDFYDDEPIIDYRASGIVRDSHGIEHYESKEEEDRNESAFYEGLILGFLLSIPAWIMIIGVFLFLRRLL